MFNSLQCQPLLLAHKPAANLILPYISSAPLKGAHHQYYLFPFWSKQHCSVLWMLLLKALGSQAHIFRWARTVVSVCRNVLKSSLNAVTALCHWVHKALELCWSRCRFEKKVPFWCVDFNRKKKKKVWVQFPNSLKHHNTGGHFCCSKNDVADSLIYSALLLIYSQQQQTHRTPPF